MVDNRMTISSNLFSKSWATNATIAASAFAAIFGSTDVLKDIVGTDDKSTVALLGVTAAIALGFVTVGPLAVGALKDADGNVTRGGVLPRTVSVTIAQPPRRTAIL